MTETKKVFKWMSSVMAERAWLEEMSEQGWFLKDIRWAGCRYIFEKGEPMRTVYEVERFDLAKNPSRREIQEKAQFVEMAEEMGWSMVCHSVGMNYYLAKPWEEGEANELYGSPEERSGRIERYKDMFWGKIKVLLVMAIAVMALGIVCFYLPEELEEGWFSVFAMAYGILCCVLSLLFFSWSRKYERELKLSLEEWRALYGRTGTVVKRKFIVTIGGLEQYLSRQARAGYRLVSMKVFRFIFVKSQPEEEIYMMDTRYLTNRRRKQEGRKPFRDSRDWEDQNNDWQVQSLHEAEKAGWEFVCAVESRNILYRAPAGSGARQLNDRKGLRIGSAVGGAAMLMIVAGLAGGLIGGLIGFFIA